MREDAFFWGDARRVGAVLAAFRGAFFTARLRTAAFLAGARLAGRAGRAVDRLAVAFLAEERAVLNADDRRVAVFFAGERRKAMGKNPAEGGLKCSKRSPTGHPGARG
jgi:hypothetical protein